MKKVVLTIFIINVFFVSNASLSTEVLTSTQFNECVQNADDPMNKTGGPNWDDLNSELALKICNKAYEKHPDSVEIIRSLSRIYLKKENYLKGYELIKLSAEKKDPFSLWYLASMYHSGEEIETNYSNAIKYYKLAMDLDYPAAFNDYGIMFEYGEGVKKDLHKALEYYKIAAQKGFDVSQNNLGLLYSEGVVVKRDLKKAFDYFKLAADQGYDSAQYQLGMAYQNGEGVDKDPKKAFNYFKLSADQGYLDSINEIGMSYFDGHGVEKNLEQSFKYFKIAADKGLDQAQYNIGIAYQMGYGVNPDLQKAIEQYKLAADQGNSDAQANLAYLYGHEEEFKDYQKAFLYNKLAAAQGDFVAQNNIGVAYEYGEGIKKDLKKAFEYYKLSADQGYDVAQNNLAYFYKYREGVVDKDLKKAFYYHKLSAEQGNADGQYNVGQALETGLGVDKDVKKGFEYILKAASNGYSPGYTHIGWNYHQGINVPRDFKKAYQHYKKAGNESYALDNIGTLYRLGQGVDPDFKKAMEYYNLSIQHDQDNPYPLYHLGLMYYKGYGVNRNINKAIELFSRSVENGSSKATDELSEIYELGIGVERDLNKALYWIKKAEKIEEEDRESLAGIGYLNIGAIKKFKTAILSQQIQNKTPSKISLGKYYALMIGISDYDNLSKLKTPLNDIQILGNILKENYDFEIIKMINPTRKQITTKLSKVEKKLLKNDSLLIYYAGHGVEKDGYGYWLPKNAEIEDDSEWLSNDYVTKKIKSIKANNILVIADSCYSGTLTRGISTSDEQKKLPINSYLETKSRMVMSSGGVKPVIDGGGGDHSIFARMLINKLKSNTKPLISAELYSSITKKVTEASINYNYEQIPNLASLPQSGHEAPDFVFIPK